jgi:hypothetical protein
MQAQGESTAETQAALRAERVAGWLRVPLIVAALLAIPTIIVQESGPGDSGRFSPRSWTGASGRCSRPTCSLCSLSFRTGGTG